MNTKTSSHSNTTGSQIHCRLLGFALLMMALSLSSCQNTGNNSVAGEKDTLDLSEGVITYAISYPNIEDGKVSPFFPKEISLVFKGNLSSYIIRSGLGTVKIVRLLDFDKQEFISLLIDTWGTNYACQDTPEEIREKESSADYSYTFTDETVLYDGLTCKRALVKDRKTQEEFEIYYAPDIAINNWNSPYIKLNKLLIAYPFQENGMDMFLRATKIEAKPIDSSFFTVKGEFEWISTTQFNDHLKSLQK